MIRAAPVHTKRIGWTEDGCGGAAMEAQLWDLFRETGEPMGYLLYRAEKKRKQKRKSGEKGPAEPGRKEGAPASSA